MKRAALISVIVGAALAIVPAAFAAEMSDGGGVVGVARVVTMAPTSYQDALRTYGSTSTPHQLGGGSEAVTPLSQIDPAIQAVLVRNRTQSVPLTGKALADFYDTGAVVTSQPSVRSANASVNTLDPATKAVLLRSEGLANYYGSPYTKSLLLQSQALVDYYSTHPVTTGVTLHTDTLGGNGNPDVAPASTGNSFDWGNALAVTLAAMLILAIAATTITRRRHRLSY